MTALRSIRLASTTPRANAPCSAMAVRPLMRCPRLAVSCAKLAGGSSSAAKDTTASKLHVAKASISMGTFSLPDIPIARVETMREHEGIVEKARAALFFGLSFILAVPMLLAMAAATPLVLATDKFRRLTIHAINNMWARACTSLFYDVEVQGRENLPPPDKPVVYVANHQSFLDIYTLYHLDRPFKFISKKSIFMIPIIGWCMYMTGHVVLSRMDMRSQLECLTRCRELLQHDAPVMFFPEGARSEDGVMVGFKKGAFSVACKAGADIIPITLMGTGDLMRSGGESKMRGGRVSMQVHPAIHTKGRTADEVCNEARNAIASGMPAHLVGSATQMAPDHA